MRPTVSRHGFVLVPDVEARDLRRIAQSFGEIRVDPRSPDPFRRIRPCHRESAKANTLSSRFGLGAFPFHTDAAHWRRPPRYLMLYCLSPGLGERPTYLIDGRSWFASADARRRSLNEVWKVGHRRPYLGAMSWETAGTFRWRYDAECMSPVTMGAVELASELAAKVADASRVEIAWAPGSLLIIDNHRILHARGDAVRYDPDREHVRVLVGG